MPTHPTIAVLIPQDLRAALFSAEDWRRLGESGTVVACTNAHEQSSVADAHRYVADADVVVTSWGSPKIDEALLAAGPRIRLYCHAAGTVKPYTCDAVWARGIAVTTSAPAIALEVAISAVGWIIVGAKRHLWGNLATMAGGWRDQMRYPSADVHRAVVGIVGASHVGRRTIELLRPFPVEILLSDPYVTVEEAKALGARKVELDELMRASDVVSLHAPATAETRHMIDGAMLGLLRDGVTLVNTARGHLIDETALAKELETGRIWAILDVTDPEPPAANHPFRTLPNVTLTPHIAGTTGAGLLRLGEYVVEEVRRFANGEPPRYPVRFDALARTA